MSRELTLDDMAPMLESVFCPLPERPRFLWPDAKHVAMIFQLSVEYFGPGQPKLYSGSPAIIPMPIPPGAFDFANWAWKSYGLRVGLWRLLEAFVRHEVPVSASTNARVHEVHPEITAALREAGCELLLCHGYEQDRCLLEFLDDLEGHRKYVVESLRAHERVTGLKPKGWSAPAFAMLPQTLSVCADEGIEWFPFPCDDQPFVFEVGEHSVVGVPYGLDLIDFGAFTRAHEPFAEWANSVLEQVDVLCDEARETGSGRVAMIGVHPHVMGHPQRIRRFDQLLARLRERTDLWWATQTEVATFFRDEVWSATPT